ncbi:MAG: crossover junction endodeoxyribonuclease RuvC [Thermoflexales bacterium]|nr:crossover junction endodeoxyribonuclease RuvC [Thermoflexales bacterium]
MIALGVDPGLATTGYAFVAEATDGTLTALAYGVITTPQAASLPARLGDLNAQLSALIARWKPNEAAIESLFFATNARTAMSVGQARGVVLLTVYQARLPLFEYTPLQVKQAVSGYGKADKRQMQEMVRLLLRLDQAPKPDDAADALAVAVTHLHLRRWAGAASTA